MYLKTFNPLIRNAEVREPRHVHRGVRSRRPQSRRKTFDGQQRSRRSRRSLEGRTHGRRDEPDNRGLFVDKQEGGV